MFTEILKQEQWESVLRSDDANFINTLNTLYNFYSPVNKVNIEDTCRKKPVLSNGLKTHVVRRIIFTDYFFGIQSKSLNIDTKRTKTN